MEPLAVFLAGFGHWHWWVLGVVLLGAEMLAPGVFLLWMGIAAGATGVVVLVAPEMDWRYQFLLFAVLAVASVIAARIYLKRRPIETDRPELNRRGQQYVGRTFTLAEAMENGRGRLHVDDTMWRVIGPDIPAGRQVEVVGVDGVLLRVAPAREGEEASSPSSD
jgi:membrane protein implicated in regulation of membrane protease activity